MASPSTGAPALEYGDVKTVTPSPGEVKGLIVIRNGEQESWGNIRAVLFN